MVSMLWLESTGDCIVVGMALSFQIIEKDKKLLKMINKDILRGGLVTQVAFLGRIFNFKFLS